MISRTGIMQEARWEAPRVARRTLVPVTVLELFDAQVTAAPDAVAVVHDGRQVTYGELDQRVNRLARGLIRLGVEPDTHVVLMMGLSLDLIVAIYAVAKAGGAVLPIDPEQPAVRVAAMVAAVDPICILTASRRGTAPEYAIAIDAVRRPADHSPIRPAERAKPIRLGDPAYTIFTKDQSGHPVASTVSHGTIADRLDWLMVEFGLRNGNTALSSTDSPILCPAWDLCSPLLVGGTVVVPDAKRY